MIETSQEDVKEKPKNSQPRVVFEHFENKYFFLILKFIYKE